MTLYMVFAALDADRLTLTQRLPVSAHAARMQPTRLGRYPEVPGVTEALGARADLEVAAWTGILAPAKVPTTSGRGSGRRIKPRRAGRARRW